MVKSPSPSVPGCVCEVVQEAKPDSSAAPRAMDFMDFMAISSGEQFRRGGLDFVPDQPGNGAGGHAPIRLKADTNDGQGAARDKHGRRRVELAEFESVGQGLGFFFGDEEMNFHLVLEL